MMSQAFFTLVILLICCAKPLLADTICGDWQAYKDEKCVKLFDTLLSYEEASKTCSQYNSLLITIESVDDQQIIENYLFAAPHSIVENVWTGLKYVNTTYKWINDNLHAEYTNWAEHSPKNKSDLCVQISADELGLGKWSDISCAKKNFALCQRLPTFTMQSLMTMLIETRRKLEISVSEQHNTRSLLQSYLFSDKWRNIKTFVENSTHKALIYPYKTQTRVTRPNAIELCKQNNATLVDIESAEKQLLVQSFLYQMSRDEYWIGGYPDPDDKHKWLNSGNEFQYTNWATNNNPLTYPHVSVYSYYNDTNDGKWYTIPSDYALNVICEIKINF